MTAIATELSTDIHIITAEINAYKRVAGEAIFEIGRRLKYVKETKLAEGRGGWTQWLHDVDIEQSQARRFIAVADEIGEEYRGTYHALGLRALYEIATLPPEERERPHTVPSTGATKMVDEMTVRELREVKAALKQTEEERDQALASAKRAQEAELTLRDTVESIRAQGPRIVEKPVIKEVVPTHVQLRIRQIEHEKEEMEASLIESYDRIRELEKLERSVRNQTESPLYDIYRSATGTVGYFKVFADNERLALDIIAGADRQLLDKIKAELTMLERFSQRVRTLIDEETGVIVIDSAPQNKIIEVTA